MMYAKKVCVDVLHMALILAFVRFGPEVLLNNQQNELEVGEMFLGTTMGYRQFSSPNDYALANRYMNLKTLDSLIMDRTAFIRDQLSHLRNSGEQRNNIYAYYNEENAKVPASTVNKTTETESDTDPQFNTSSESTPFNYNAISRSPPEVLDEFHSVSVVDLSPEDMGIIEILWKQDIDLGVSRDAYSSYENHESEKEKLETELPKPTHVTALANSSSDVYKEKDQTLENQKPEHVNQWEGLNYSVDDETGEYVLQDQKLDEGDQNLPPELSLFNSNDLLDFPPNMFSEDYTASFDFPKMPVDEDEIPQQLLEDFLPNLDDLFAEVEKLEEIVPKNEESSPNPEEGSEMYPSMEEYWQDISTTLPLSVMGGSYPFVPIVPRPVRAYPVSSFENPSDAHSSSFELAPRPNDAFQGVLLQNATLTSRSPDINNTFGYLPSVLGPTSLGCAVASSIATLTNDTDPMPDVSGVLNATFGLDLPAVLQPNHSSALAPSNESLISDLLMVEDLQLMNAAAVSSVAAASDDVPCHVLKISNENMELSSDSVASSMSGNMSSVSNDNSQPNLEELSSIEYVGKDSQYTTLKYPLNSPYINPGYRQPEASPHSPNLGFNSQSFRVENEYGHYVQHNHSYHLPFTNCNMSPKPLARDKSRSSKYDDDAQNRDEKRAKALKLPISINDIINLGIDEFNEKLSKFELTEPQLTLIRDIRRRGKNKVAAQNCRKRKMDQISNLQQALDFLETERLQLESERAQLLHQRRNVRDKYTQLCQFVIQSTSHHQPIPNVFPLTRNSSSGAATFAGSASSTSDSSKSEDKIFNQGVRTKRKIEKKRLDLT